MVIPTCVENLVGNAGTFFFLFFKSMLGYSIGLWRDGEFLLLE